MATDRQFLRLVGLEQAKAQLRELPRLVTDPSYRAIRASVDAITAAAQSAVPTRRQAYGGYTGGALKAAITGRTSRTHLIGLIGIARGARVVSLGGLAQSRVTTQERVSRVVRLKSGALVTRSYRRTLSAAKRRTIGAAGGRVIQPTRYGHFVEFGGQHNRALAFLRSAVRRHQAGFEANVRATAPDILAALAARGTMHPS